MSKFSLFRSGLLGAGLAAASGLYTLGRRAASAIDKDRAFPTWKGTMPYRRPMRPRGRAGMRRPQRMVLYRRPRDTQYANIRRTTAVYSLNIPSGAYNAYATNSIKLNTVKTSDLVAAYDLYRIRKVQVVFTPAYDPGNSGISSNNHIQVCAACDPSTSTAPTTVLDFTAYDNHRSNWLVAGKPFVYTFSPRS